MYHASQSQETKAFIQRNFRSSDSELRYLSATIAFGMVHVYVCVTHFIHKCTVYTCAYKHCTNHTCTCIYIHYYIHFPHVCRGLTYLMLRLLLSMAPQIRWHSSIRLLTKIIFVLKLQSCFQMYGRAGRNGCLARAHLLYTARQARQLKDTSLKCFASEASNENCRRKEMLISLGSSESVMSSARCCDICSGNVVPSSRLDVMVPTALRRPRKPRAVRYITSEMGDVLKQTLLEEREKLLEEFPGFKMIGRSFILSDKTIDELCKLSTSLSSVEDLNGIVTLRRELRSRIFSKIMDVISCAPSPKKKQRNN